MLEDEDFGDTNIADAATRDSTSNSRRVVSNLSAVRRGPTPEQLVAIYRHYNMK